MNDQSFKKKIKNLSLKVKDLDDVEGTKLDAKKIELLDALLEISETADRVDEQIGFIKRQHRSITLTGFANWDDVHKYSSTEKETTLLDRLDKDSSTGVVEKINKSKVTFPKFDYPSNQNPETNVRVASILDTFSERAFSYEWDNVALSKEGWRHEIEGCDLLFVESAWAGNNNDWRYCLTGASAPRPEVIDLVAYARSLGIPSIFWNKEDPPHFADFLRTASLFDIVLTTDASCVDRYKKELQHDRVGVLPFAAQPRIHNPIRPEKVLRNKQVSFGGMYFAHKYPERRQQMEYLLPAASKFQFDIFSRQLGGDPNYQFPAPFDANVVGSLSYEEMLSAYHAYAVFLNVNSVTTSTTMCARRIFEILASGASVVSAPSPAIEAYFPNGLVPMPANEEETYQEIRTLLQPGGYREKLVMKAQRRIWREHTFAHRVDEIYRWAGLTYTRQKPTISVIAPTFRKDYVENILQSVARQVNVTVELNILLHGVVISEAAIRNRAIALGIENINILYADKESTLGENLNRLVAISSGDLISKMDDDDYYGATYLEDLLNAKMFSNADVVGKASAYIHFESKNATILSYSASENRFSNFVRGATLTADRDLFTELPFQNLNRSEDSTFLKQVINGGGKIYASDRFNFWIRRSDNQGHHTWTVADRELFATGPVVSYGDPTEFVEA